MPLQRAEAQFNFDPTAGVELKLRKGDIVQVRRTSVGDGWWEGELNGFRGLFPSSYVKLLPEQSPSHESPRSVTSEGGVGGGPGMPLTPGLSKKGFMEALLAPTNMAHGQHFNEERAGEIFMEQHSNVTVTVGPSWSCQPPSLTISVKHAPFNTRASVSSKQLLLYAVETREYGSSVTRKYKQFLWLYDKLAEGFPCISLPPLPVKQSSTPKDFDGLKAWRAGLEKFLMRVANHPVLSCTKVFHLFLTAKDDKEWKIGRHNSHIKVPKSARKLFSAPVYTAVEYPAYNVPLTQLASIDKFAKFTRLLESNVQCLQSSCQHVSGAMGDLMHSFNYLGKDLQKFSRGIQLNTGARRKLYSSTVGGAGLGNGLQNASIHVSLAGPKVAPEEDNASDEEVEGGVDWNWREDESFQKMCKDLYDIAGGIRGLSKLGQEHGEAVDKDVADTLREYSSIIHTLPVLVKLHEEAMELFKTSKEKDSKKDAEEIRQHCETLNNILLAEFDNFSLNMVQDFENMMERLLRQQVKFHTQMASEWDALHRLYSKRLSSSSSAAAASRGSQPKRPFSPARLSRQSADGYRARSGSLKNSFASSMDSTSSMHDTPLARDMRSHSSPAPPIPPPKPNSEVNAPLYINVQRKPAGAADVAEPDDFVDPETFNSMKVEPRGEEEEEEEVEGTWPEDKQMHVECDEETCRLVEPKASDSLPVQEDERWIVEGGMEVANNGNFSEDPVASSSYPHHQNFLQQNQYDDEDTEFNTHLDSQKSHLTERYETEQAEKEVDDGGSDTEEEEMDTRKQPHLYKNIPLLRPEEDDDELAEPPDNFSQHDVEEEPQQSVGSASKYPIYSNIAVIQSTSHQSTHHGSISSGSPPSEAKQLPPPSSTKLAKKPMPIQRKRTKSENTLEGEVPAAAPSSSSNSHELTLAAAPASDLRGKAAANSPSSARKKPTPPVKPAKLSTILDHSSQAPAKRPNPPLLAKKDCKPNDAGGRPRSSSLSDEGESSHAAASPSLKLRALTQCSSDKKPKKPLLPSAMTAPSIITGIPPSDVRTDMPTCTSSKAELSRSNVDDQVQSSSGGLKVCGVLVSTAEEKFPASPEDDVSLSEERPPSPKVPPPSSIASKAPPPDPPQNEKTVIEKVRPPAKPPRLGSIKRKSSTSSLQKSASSSAENSPSGRDELMKKLSMRRLKIEEQIAVKTGGSDLSSVRTSETSDPFPSDFNSLSEDSEERASVLSSSSANSEVVVAYHTKGGGGTTGGSRHASSHASSANGLMKSGSGSGHYKTPEGSDVSVTLRREPGEEEGGSLAKYGIIEDVAGGSFII